MYLHSNNTNRIKFKILPYQERDTNKTHYDSEKRNFKFLKIDIKNYRFSKSINSSRELASITTYTKKDG